MQLYCTNPFLWDSVFSLPWYIEGKTGVLWLLFLTVTFLRFYYLNFQSFFIFWEIYLSLDCVWGLLSLNFLPCPGFSHLTLIHIVLFVHSFCEIVLILCQPYSSWGRAFLLWWVSSGRCWAPMRCHCPFPLDTSYLKWDPSLLRCVDCTYLADEVLCY